MTISINLLINFIDEKPPISRHESSNMISNMIAPRGCYVFFVTIPSAPRDHEAMYFATCSVNLGGGSRRLIRVYANKSGNKRERDRCPSICIARLSRHYHRTITQILASEENAEYRRKARPIETIDPDSASNHRFIGIYVERSIRFNSRKS